MTGRMIDFPTEQGIAPGYLATPNTLAGPGVIVLHAWWGLTEPFRDVCDRLTAAGYIALAPDFYRGKTATTVEAADGLGSALDEKVEQWRGDIRGAVSYLRQNGASGPVGLLGFSLGGGYALDMSVQLPDEIGAVVVFYDAYPTLDYADAKAAYLLHYAEDDTFVSAAKVAGMEQALRTAGKETAIYTYPGTKHWFFEANQPSAYDAVAANLAWERTLAFLEAHLRT